MIDFPVGRKMKKSFFTLIGFWLLISVASWFIFCCIFQPGGGGGGGVDDDVADDDTPLDEDCRIYADTKIICEPYDDKDWQSYYDDCLVGWLGHCLDCYVYYSIEEYEDCDSLTTCLNNCD